MSNSDGEERITLVAFAKDDAIPVGIATFLKGEFPHSYRASNLDEMSRPILLEMGNKRKITYELQYCLRRKNARSMLLGYALLGCGIEVIGNLPLQRSKEN